ncbi:MAG: cytochrome b/b6 domain-containing protein [Pandoraea sp.]|nr:cytochrome b/b6 domain-containing protein [Pandoraea sp.]MDR3398850.1 cytochrome b/b6 domain-containing protein [Pandoraea sp.]
MQLQDTGLRFSRVTVVLHWLVAVLLFAIIALEFAIVPGSHASGSAALSETQNLLGLILCLVSIYRFWARVSSYHPLPVGTPNPVEIIISRSVAVALALAMVLLPVAAWLYKASAGEVMGLPGGFHIPAVIAPNLAVQQVVGVLFKIGGIAFLAGLVLHIFGAMKNHFVLKNDTLKRMLGKHVEL